MCFSWMQSNAICLPVADYVVFVCQFPEIKVKHQGVKGIVWVVKWLSLSISNPNASYVPSCLYYSVAEVYLIFCRAMVCVWHESGVLRLLVITIANIVVVAMVDCCCCCCCCWRSCCCWWCCCYCSCVCLLLLTLATMLLILLFCYAVFTVVVVVVLVTANGSLLFFAIADIVVVSYILTQSRPPYPSLPQV